MNQRVLWMSLIVLVAFGMPTRARCATLQVANTGLDGPTCGPAAPCRSIGQAVANAAPGDTIEVGPGFYSMDLDGNGTMGEPGEEPAGGVIIDKALELVSTRGASNTMIRSLAPAPIILITASNVTLGKLGNGFTFASTISPLLIGGASELVNVRVSGNVIAIEINAGDGAAGIISDNTRGRFEHNRIVAPSGCFAGFVMSSSQDVIARNVVMGCAEGFYLQNTRGARLIRNAAIGNSDTGFVLSGSVTEFTGNLAIDNETGVNLDTSINTFRSNTFAGNRSHCGVRNLSGTTITATNNYWGAPTGPSPNGDTVCDGPAVTSPFLTNDPTGPQAALR